MYDSDMAYNMFWFLGVGGRLHLTSTRLIWIRWRWGLPLGRKVISLELGDIRRYGARRVWWLVRGRALAIELAHTPDTIWFAPIFGFWESGLVKEWAEAIADAVKGSPGREGLASP